MVAYSGEKEAKDPLGDNAAPSRNHKNATNADGDRLQFPHYGSQ